MASSQGWLSWIGSGFGLFGSAETKPTVQVPKAGDGAGQGAPSPTPVTPAAHAQWEVVEGGEAGASSQPLSYSDAASGGAAKPLKTKAELKGLSTAETQAQAQTEGCKPNEPRTQDSMTEVSASQLGGV